MAGVTQSSKQGLPRLMSDTDTPPIMRFMGKYRFLNNFYPCIIGYEGGLFPTVEHAFQAAKTLDKPTRAAIAALHTAGHAKRAGRRVQLRPDWEKVKIGIMEELLHLKFRRPGLRVALLNTGDAELIEGNTWGDKFWGADIRILEHRHGDGSNAGLNMLGKLLMEERKRLRE